jgi:hypothetical protein
VFRELLRSLEQRLVLETRGLRKPAEATPLQRTTMVPDCDNIACSDETLVVHVRAAAALLQHPDALHYPLWQPGAFERHDPQYPATGYLHDGHAPEKRAAFEDACVELRNFRAAQSGDSNAAFRHLLVEDAELLSSQDAVDMLHIVHTTGLVDLTAPGTRVRAVLVAHRVPVPRQMGAPWLLAAMDRALLDTDCAWAGPRYPGVADVDWLRRVLGRTGKDHWIDHRVVLRVVHGPRELCKVWQPASGQRVSAVPVVKKVRVPKKPVAEPPLLLVATRDRHGAHRGLQRTSAPVPMLPYNAELLCSYEGLVV